MVATRDDICSWLERAMLQNASHMIILHDGLTNEDYPVHVRHDQDIDSVIEGYDNTSVDQISIVEVYNMEMSIATQMCEERAYHP